ncbi:hypothetical protein CKK33_06340 [Mucilaginibacter sp. MD40]|uniref:hypothetical protein n=1 Tax=Mucilaginibacter sp. MD40 TaxID=2029590 RepID=UPI000BAC5E41|nr:hypothetical protein [Mucilaginibacter sp. MD40]PAW93131.1 hypothetical protein CKK33_06340 [Mucilaginibacter sp. MD40]
MKHIITRFNLLLLALAICFAACNKGTSEQLVLPQITTNDVIVDASGTQAWTGGLVTSQNALVTEFGICYSTANQQPTTADNKVVGNLNSHSFVVTLKGLTPGTTYYARAYASNSSGASYGSVIQFKTGTVAPAYGTVTTFAGSIAGYADGSGLSALFNNPLGTVVDAAGNLYVSDSYNCSIRKITPDGMVTTIAGSGSIGGANGTETGASFYAPAGLAIDAAGNLYVADLGNNLIRKVTPAGVVTTFAGSGNAGYTDATGTDASFSAPSALAMGSDGSLYVADSGTGLIRKVTPGGVVTTLAGNHTQGYTNAVGTSASFNSPSGIAIDATGNIYVAEPQNRAIRKIATDNTVTTFAGGPDSTVAAPIGVPQAIAIDAANNMFITDGNGRVLEINKDHVLSVVAGSNATGTTDGVGSNAMFSSPAGIVVGTNGIIYVADMNNNRIRKIKQQ